MNKREKIIIAIAAVAVIAGGLYMLFSSSGKEKAKVDVAKAARDELMSFVGTVSVDMGSRSLKPNESYVIAGAEDKWGKDPFLWTELADIAAEAQKKEENIQFPAFTYSGFMNVGKKKMAIINGLEYEQGEELEPGGFMLLSIDSNKLVIGAKGKQQQTIVPMEEEIL